MQTFSLGVGKWLRCLSTRNPLVRFSDRVEAVGVLLIAAIALLSVPIIGAVGTATHDSLARQYAADRMQRHDVVATVSGDSVLSPRAYQEPFLTPIRWEFHLKGHTGEVRTPRMKVGDTMSIWVDTAGNQTTQPLSEDDAATEAVVTGFGLWFATVGLAAALWTVIRLRLDRSRSAAWDRELAGLADNGGRANRGKGPWYD